ncbi:cytochrome P450-like protein 4 [Leptotrombidium deliense]|uniref:Cytochrome P450-like protein 4 n=1 Tax=Leptotrombidium deliense TaxID=299467 RepID=A0A443S8B1_9ACAR|nr:cytochrome P450-like protein 4 [Leptotrombidium deliense]
MTYLINERRSHKVENNDMLQLLLDAETDELNKQDETDNQFFEESIQSVDNKNVFKNFIIGSKKLTADEILAQSVLLMLGGYHTTAVLLGYCCYSLAIYPRVQEELYAKLSSVFSKEEDMNYENINSCVYLDAFISETLRYYPPTTLFQMD